jgi:hypothetical protein
LLYRLGIALLAVWLIVPQCAFSQQSSQPGRGAPGGSGQTIINPVQSPYNAICNGVADDTAALNSALGQGGRVVRIPAGATCSVDHLIIPANTILQGVSVGSTTLIIAGTGGGPCGPGTNGGVELLAGAIGQDTIDNLTIEAVNPALGCLINISANTPTGCLNPPPPGSGIPRCWDVPYVTLRNLQLTTSGLQPAVTNPIALYTNNTTFLRLDNVNIDGTFRQQWLALGDLNGASVTGLTLHPNSSNLPGGVYNDSNPMVSFAAYARGVYLAGLDCKQGPICLKTGPCSFGMQISGAQSKAGIYHCTPWLPRHPYPAGACVFPSILATAGTYAENYAGHVYVTPQSGVSGESAPGFPTGHNATVADGSVTWIEYGRGSTFELDAPGTSVSGNTIAGKAGVSVYAGASAQGLSISGNQFYAPSVAAVYAESASGLLIADNQGTSLLKLKNPQAAPLICFPASGPAVCQCQPDSSGH